MLSQSLAFLLFGGALVTCSSTDKFDTQPNFDVALVDVVPTVPTFENLAIRKTGEVLVTSVASSLLYQISPNASYLPVPVAGIPNFTGILGIAELQTDLFYVVSSNLTGTACSNAVWEIDLRNSTVTPSGDTSHQTKASLIKEFCTARQLNGLTTLSTNDTSNLLISDSANGTVYKLNVKTGDYNIVLEEPEFDPLDTGISVGINGIHVYDEALYFTSLDQGLFARIPISLETGCATGAVEVLATNITYGDDFTISPQGSHAWIATNGPNGIVEVDIANKTQRIAASSPFLGSASSVAFGYWQSERILYVTGGLAVGVSSNNTRGHLAAVRLD